MEANFKVPVGRGMKWPITFQDGGIAWNMDEDATIADALAAAMGAVRLTIMTPRGSCFMNREFGTEADALVFATATAATADALLRTIEEALPKAVPYITIHRLSAVPLTDAIAVELVFGLRYATRTMTAQALIPARGV